MDKKTSVTEKMAKFFIFAFLTASLSISILAPVRISHAEDINSIMDNFYNGLADIIERNMDSPEQCILEVDIYYKDNRATIEKIRKMTERGMSQSMAMMDKYGSMSEEELEMLEVKARRRSEAQYPVPKGATRYTEAMAAFSAKYPQYALGIATKAMQFLPVTEMDE